MEPEDEGQGSEWASEERQRRGELLVQKALERLVVKGRKEE
jgi:hypothetical protein